ncbi:hypothetical protein RUM44_008449 [Polyplax serrata]|uniref:Uncharacterized protein n=1 Tax=Polyplax serrata TaxID=468196 RepID=A0ABR1BAE0_POLSC
MTEQVLAHEKTHTANDEILDGVRGERTKSKIVWVVVKSLKHEFWSLTMRDEPLGSPRVPPRDHSQLTRSRHRLVEFEIRILISACPHAFVKRKNYQENPKTDLCLVRAGDTRPGQQMTLARVHVSD